MTLVFVCPGKSDYVYGSVTCNYTTYESLCISWVGFDILAINDYNVAKAAKHSCICRSADIRHRQDKASTPENQISHMVAGAGELDLGSRINEMDASGEKKAEMAGDGPFGYVPPVERYELPGSKEWR